MSKLTGKWFDIFRAGSKYGDIVFTDKDVRDIVSNYDPSHDEAPAVLGHPKDNAPAYGWFDAVRKSGDLLQGRMRQVDPAFEEAVEAGRFKKRSVKLAQTPKGWTLKHVGFLGAKLPGVKGLADIQFSQEEDTVEIEFSEESGMSQENNDSLVTSIVEGLKKAWNGKPAGTPAATFSEADVTAMVTKAATEAAAAAVKPLEEKLATQEAKFSERETKIVTGEAKQRALEAITGLKTKGAWVPAFDKIGIPALFEELASRTVTVEFGEGADKKTETPLQILVTFMEANGKIVPGGQHYNGEKPGSAPDTSKINPRGRAKADPNSARLSDLAKAHAKEHNVTFGEALSKVSQDNPELCVPGGASAGSV